MQRDQKLNLEDTVDTLKRAGVPEDEMAALERQLAPAAVTAPSTNTDRKLGFVSAGVESQPGREVTANNEDIELPEDNDSDDELNDEVEIAQKDVPAAVFGDLAKKVDNDKKRDGSAEDDDGKSRLGALERIKRQRRQ